MFFCSLINNILAKYKSCLEKDLVEAFSEAKPSNKSNLGNGERSFKGKAIFDILN
jgi:hypothetical protein